MKLALLFSLLISMTVSASDWLIPISQVRTELAQGQGLPLGNTIQFRIENPGAQKISENLSDYQGINAEMTGQNQLDITLDKHHVFTGGILPRHRHSSFVIDFDEPSVVGMTEQFKSQYAAPFRIKDIAEFISVFLDKPSLIHGFNIASKVAVSKAGDCTEYAVLTTALARALGFPARLMVGTTLIEEQRFVLGFGHAWTEVYADDKWQILDAALYKANKTQRFYLPIAELSNEGPGFSLSLISTIGLSPAALQDVRSVP